jgi:hypothetical protein
MLTWSRVWTTQDSICCLSTFLSLSLQKLCKQGLQDALQSGFSSACDRQKKKNVIFLWSLLAFWQWCYRQDMSEASLAVLEVVTWWQQGWWKHSSGKGGDSCWSSSSQWTWSLGLRYLSLCWIKVNIGFQYHHSFPSFQECGTSTLTFGWYYWKHFYKQNDTTF